MAFCSAVTLCFAAICAVVSAALLAIAFSTDNWQVIHVERAKLNVSIYMLTRDDTAASLQLYISAAVACSCSAE